MDFIKKYLPLILVIALIGFFVFGNNSPFGQSSVDGTSNEGSETSWFELFLSWLPMLILCVFYVIFLRMMKCI